MADDLSKRIETLEKTVRQLAALISKGGSTARKVHEEPLRGRVENLEERVKKLEERIGR
jgi:polyhydroxyalkanoate synthesis regulator phasin